MLILRCQVAVRHQCAPAVSPFPSTPPLPPPPFRSVLARNSPTLQTTSMAFPREYRGCRHSLVRPWGEEGKPFRCSTGRRTMHLRPHSLSRQSSPSWTLLLHSASRRVVASNVSLWNRNYEKLNFDEPKLRIKVLKIGRKNVNVCIIYIYEKTA